MLLRNLMVGICFFGVSQAAIGADETGSENTFSGLIELGGDRSVGNSDNSAFNAKLELGHRYGDWSNEFTFDASQKKESGVITEDKYDVILKSIYNLPAHFYTFIRLGYREDSFSGIYYERSTIGGFGYHAFTDEPKYSLDFELGYGQRVTRKLDILGAQISKLDYDPGTHLALIGQYNFSKEDTLKGAITAELGNDDDYIKKEFSWAHQLFDNLQLSISYEARTITKPGAGKVRTDATTTYKLGYSF